jgi:TM2 domain-containing membrane protein YozV
LAKSLKITILIAILVSGVGRIYLGVIKRGIIILVVGIALWIIVPLFVAFPLSWGDHHWILDLANGGCILNLQKERLWTDRDY